MTLTIDCNFVDLNELTTEFRQSAALNWTCSRFISRGLKHETYLKLLLKDGSLYDFLVQYLHLR